MSALPTLLSPVKVLTMSPELLSRIAGETEETQVQRQQLTKQLNVLSKGLGICEQFGVTKINQDARRKGEESSEQVAASGANQLVLDKKAKVCVSSVAPEETQFVPSEEEIACDPADVMESRQAVQMAWETHPESDKGDGEVVVPKVCSEFQRCT